VVRCDSSFWTLVSDALVDEPLHSFDKLGSRESGAWVDCAAEPAIYDAAHTFEDTAEEAFRQCFLSSLFNCLLVVELPCRVFSVSHE
jgi:hypothetical protein